MPHLLQPALGGPHVQHPAREAVTRPALDPNLFEPLALLDLGFISPELAGSRCLCVAMNVAAVYEHVIFGEQKDGTWTVVEVDGGPPVDPTRGSRYGEPFEDGPDGFAELPCFEACELVDTGSARVDRTQHVLLQIGEPAWLQGDESPGGDWIFVARLDSYYLFGSVYVFYDPKTRRAWHRIQCT